MDTQMDTHMDTHMDSVHLMSEQPGTSVDSASQEAPPALSDIYTPTGGAASAPMVPMMTPMVPMHPTMTLPAIHPSSSGVMNTIRAVAKPRDYDGNTSWRTYRGHFDKVAQINGWGEEKKDYLFINLSGIALSFVEGLPDVHSMTYEELSEALDRRFGAERLAAIHKATLLAVKRKSGQSLADLGQEVRKLCACAYPDFPPAALEEIAIERFLDALHQPEMRLAIHQTKPTTLDHAIETGLQREAWITADEHRHGRQRVRAVDTGDENAQALRDLREEVRQLRAERDNVKKEVKCSHCQRQGHVYKDCRTRKRQLDERACFTCGRTGHFARDCHNQKKQDQGN